MSLHICGCVTTNINLKERIINYSPSTLNFPEQYTKLNKKKGEKMNVPNLMTN